MRFVRLGRLGRRLSLLALTIVVAGCQVTRAPAPVSTRQLKVASVKRIVAQPALSPVSFSTDGRRIAFTTEHAVRVADLAGTSREIAPVGAANVISWSPRLGIIALIDAGAVWTMRDDGRERRRVALPGSAAELGWAPGSDRLAVVLRRSVEGTSRFELWLVNRDGGFRRLVTRAPVGRGIRDLQWFGDSLYLLYGVSSPDGQLQQAWRIRIAYPDRREVLIDTPATGLRLAPVGERVAYLSAAGPEEGGGRIVVSRLDGTGRLEVTAKAGRYSGLAWSPQGDKFAYAEIINDANAEIWVSDTDGSGRLHISSYALELPRPRIALSMTWSPDGRHLVFGTNTGRFTGPLWLATLERR